MNDQVPPELAKKIRLVLAGIDSGLIAPDPFELAAAAELLKGLGEPNLARECERRARRLLPNLRRDLS